jgi:hypothetical protein
MQSGWQPNSLEEQADPSAPDRGAKEAAARRATGALPFELGSIVMTTSILFRKRLASYLAVCGAVLVLSVGTYLGQGRLIRGLVYPPYDRLPYFPAAFASFFIGYVFTTWLSITQRLALLGLVRNEPAIIKQVLRGGRYLLTSLLAALTLAVVVGLILALTCLPVMVVAGILGLRTPLVTSALVAAIVPAGAASTLLATRLSQFPYLIVDREVGVVDSLRSSWSLTRSRATTLLLVFALWLLINLGGVLAGLMGCLLTSPFASLMLAVTYLTLSGTGESPLTRSELSARVAGR